MAHVKAGGASRMNRDSKPKHLGVKTYAGEKVKIGSILVRQKGTKFNPGVGVMLGGDYTIFAIKVGVVKFFQKMGKRVVSVI